MAAASSPSVAASASSSSSCLPDPPPFGFPSACPPHLHLPFSCLRRFHGHAISSSPGGHRHQQQQRIMSASLIRCKSQASGYDGGVATTYSKEEGREAREGSASSSSSSSSSSPSSAAAQVDLASSMTAATASPSAMAGSRHNPPRIIIAGGGIGGLVLALAAKNKGMSVKVLERDLSAVRGEGQYRGPIQIQSNALAALEAVDPSVAEEIMANGCVTGDRINGLVDGLSGNWYIKFDTFTPAVEKGLPVTRVISRMTLQQILAKAVGQEIIENSSNVVDFGDDGTKVTVELEDGRKLEGDLLVGADGIWSKVRTKLFGPCEATYSGYTCYTGIADFIPADIDTVGYRVYLGHKQYFVSSDVGFGKMQWYAFHNEPAGGTDTGEKKDRLLHLFANWCDGVKDLLLATPEEMILRRDIFDRVPIFNWSRGRTTLLGDSAHAMQPNLGQGGCMAIEDAYQLSLELEKEWKQSREQNKSMDMAAALKRYENERVLRVGAIHGMARMAAIMASTYKPYLGVGLGPLEFLTNLRIPHPGRVGGRFFISVFMPLMLDWVLGGNSSKLDGRVPSCRLSDKADSNLRKWFVDDDALERATDADWYLAPSNVMMSQIDVVGAGGIQLMQEEDHSVFVSNAPGGQSEGSFVVIDAPGVSIKHAQITFRDGAFYVIDLQSAYGTWITDIEGRRFRLASLLPRRLRPGYTVGFGTDPKAAFKVKLQKKHQAEYVATLSGKP